VSTNKELRRAWELEEIAKATKFSACMYMSLRPGGLGAYDRRFASTLEEAREHAKQILREVGWNYGRRVMIYALTPTQMSLFVESVRPRERL
jgi:hypothetical protein